jgi:heme exporter protein D
MQQWHSLSEFIAMDGYGLYIWGAYGVTLACMLAEPWLVVQRRKNAWRAAAEQQEEN